MAERGTSGVKNNSFNKGLNKDMSDLYQQEGVWSHARNAINISHRGDIGAIGNEPGNILCISATYDVIGVAYKGNSEWVIFSTDDTNSEIGVFNESLCSYTPTVNNTCLGFKKTNLITGAFKETKVYWQDNLNYDRVLDFDNIPYTIYYVTEHPVGCFTTTYTDQLDCTQILLQDLVTIPCIKLSRSSGSGQLLSGSYQAAIAYSIKGIVVTSYVAVSNIQSLFSHTGVAGSLEVNISNLDQEFDEFELVIISTSNANTVARRVGFYSTNQVKITIDQISQALQTVPIAYIPLQPTIYSKSRRMDTINDYLLRIGVTQEPDFNYQPLANNITAEWYAIDYPEDYYRKSGNKTSYLRDEVHAFFIRFIYNTSQRSASYHIPGRPMIAGDDDNLNNISNQVSPDELKRWQRYNTATKTTLSQVDTTDDGGRITHKGLMGFWQSSEIYPDEQPEVWGSLCGQFIRHHLMPDDSLLPAHYKDPNSEENRIVILGAKFSNIAHPTHTDPDTGNITPIANIIGYEILRGSREGNKSIVAKGMFNNMWEYDIEGEDHKGLFQNYPYNDLNEDPYLVTGTTKTLGQSLLVKTNRPLTPLRSFKRNMYSFHSPDTTFQKPFLGETYVKIYTVEHGESRGKFKKSYKHPKEKIITNAAFETATKVGFAIGILSAVGPITVGGGTTIGFAGTDTHTDISKPSGSATILGDLVSGYINIRIAASLLAGLPMFMLQFPFYMGEGTDQALRLIYLLVKEKDHVLQFNSHGYYGESLSVDFNNITTYRQPVVTAKYIDPYVQRFNKQYVVNNLYRNRYVCVNTYLDIPVITKRMVTGTGATGTTILHDESKTTLKKITDFMAYANVNRFVTYEDVEEQNVIRKIASYYGAIKIQFRNQYGQLESIIQIPTGCCVQDADNNGGVYTSDLIFGGDVYINRYTEKNSYFFFNQWLSGEGDNTDFNYREHFNGPEPRYWADFKKYTVDDLNIRAVPSGTTLVDFQFTAPEDYYSLDTKFSIPKTPFDLIMHAFSRPHAYMYLFNSGVRDFYVETEINLAHRDWGDSIYEYFYDEHTYTDINEMFRADHISKPNYYKYDYSLSAAKTYNNFISWGKVLPKSYDPITAYTKFTVFDNRVIYSLQHFPGLLKDNWKSYLANNYRDFVGKISSIKPLNQYGAVILFEDAEPLQFPGIDQIQTKSGASFAIGDGGLFAQQLQSLANADDSLEYGSCISSRSAINTPFGLFWVSQKNGKIMHFSGQLDAISRGGMSQWFAEYLPSQLLLQYPDFPLYDNPVEGIGCQAIYDSQLELVYFTKKDYKAIYPNVTIYNNGQWMVDVSAIGNPMFVNVDINNTEYFEDCSWTISYDPKGKQWISFHDWHPHLMIPAHSHFISIKNNGLWRHNSRLDLYSNYYGVNYPWEVEFPFSGPDVSVLKSIEYMLENYRFYNNQDYHQVLDHNFDRAIIWNNEQVSGLLELILKQKNNPTANLAYPIVGLASIQTLFSKEENKYRINQFFDITNNREEFIPAGQVKMWITALNGYLRNINPFYIDYNKSVFQRKKFRHYNNRLLLRKNTSGNIKMNLLLNRSKDLISPR